MATPTRIQGENPIFLHGGEKIVFKLDFFPELIQALPYGSLVLCSAIRFRRGAKFVP